jgi:hypothetical protein
METGKFFSIMAFACAVAGIFTAVNYFQGVDEANGQLLEAKKNLAQLKETWKMRQDEWAKIEVVAARAKEAASKETPLLRELDDLKAKWRRMEGEFKYLVSSTRSAVEKVRADGVNAAFPEVKLLNGKVLTAAKIKKIEPNQISFIHADGFLMVPQDLLPDDLRSRFDLGSTSLADELESAQAAILARK